jgi:predicted ester cyclase
MRNPEVIDELVGPDFADHDAPLDQIPGPEGIKRTLETIHSSLAGFRVFIDDIIAEGDRVITRHRAEMTHVGPFFGIRTNGQTSVGGQPSVSIASLTGESRSGGN